MISPPEAEEEGWLRGCGSWDFQARKIPSRWREIRWIEASSSSDQCGKVDCMAGHVWGFRVVSLRHASPRLGGTCERRLLGQIGGEGAILGLGW